MNAPERLYLDTETVHPAGKRKVSIYRTSDTDIEYVRTDILIERVVSYILSNKPDMHILGDSCTMDELIVKDFVNYMKGE